MALNPAFATHGTRRLPLAFGYVLGVGDRVLSTITSPTTANPGGTQYGLYLLGEGEWDGLEMLAPQSQSHLTEGTIGFNTKAQYLAGITQFMHFHTGGYTIKGAGNALTSIGPDQGYDAWFGNFPSVTPPQSYSGIAYMLLSAANITNGSGTTLVTYTAFPLAPMAVWRTTRCRIFDAYGNVTGYGFTTNPAWHFVESILRFKIKPQQPPLAGLTAAEKACFNWPSIVETAARNDVILANGRPRFVGNYIFAADSTLANISETILRVSRSYQRVSGNQIYLIGDDPRASVFLMGANHIIPGTLRLGKKDVSRSPNVFVPRYRDIDIPAVSRVIKVETQIVTLNTPLSYRLFTLDSLSPFLLGDVATYGGSSDPTYNGNYRVVDPFVSVSGSLGGITDAPNQVRCVGPGLSAPIGSATGGFLGTNDARFSERAPTNVLHRSHQRMTAMQAPGLAVQPRIVPVEYDCGNSTFDQSNRLMKFERDSTLGTDTGAGWTAPISGNLTGRLEAVDDNGKALIDVENHDVITLDDWVSSEFAGAYKVTDRTITPPSGESLGQIVLQLMQYNPNAYTDVSDDPGQTYATVPTADMPFGTFPLTNAAWVLQATPRGALDPTTGLLTVRIPDLSIQWMGKSSPTLYPAASWSGLTPASPYILYVDDPAGDGVAPTFGDQAGSPPLTSDPPGRVIVISGSFMANSFVTIDLQSGIAAFFSGTGNDSATFTMPPTAGSNPANLLSWASPQSFNMAASAHMHFIQQCSADPTRLLRLIYNDSAGTTWNGSLNYAGLTWSSGASVTTSAAGVMQFTELTLAGGEQVIFGMGLIPAAGAIPFPAGYSIDKSILMAFPYSAADSGHPAHGVRAYVDVAGNAHHDYSDGSGNNWSGNSQGFLFAWKNNMGTVSASGGWVKIPLSTGRTFAVGGFSILDARLAGAPPANFPTDSLTHVLSGGQLPLPAGLTATTLQVIPCPNSFTITGNDAHGIKECIIDASLNVKTSFADGSGNTWYGSSAVFALLCG